jgi:hypothetical protein
MTSVRSMSTATTRCCRRSTTASLTGGVHQQEVLGTSHLPCCNTPNSFKLHMLVLQNHIFPYWLPSSSDVLGVLRRCLPEAGESRAALPVSPLCRQELRAHAASLPWRPPPHAAALPAALDHTCHDMVHLPLFQLHRLYRCLLSELPLHLCPLVDWT